jgi:hypothetical protein
MSKTRIEEEEIDAGGGANLNGHGLLEVLEEAMGLELIKIAARRLLVGIELDALGNELPELLSVVLRSSPESAAAKR